MIAANLAPGLTRERFGFESWGDHDEPAWQRERAEAQAAMKLPSKLRLIGSDIVQERLDEAEQHLDLMGLGSLGTLELGDARRFTGRPGWNATVVANFLADGRLDLFEALIGAIEADDAAAATAQSTVVLLGDMTERKRN